MRGVERKERMEHPIVFSERSEEEDYPPLRNTKFFWNARIYLSEESEVKAARRDRTVPDKKDALIVLLKFLNNPLVDGTRNLTEPDMEEFAKQNPAMAESMLDLAVIAEEAEEVLRASGVYVRDEPDVEDMIDWIN